MSTRGTLARRDVPLILTALFAAAWAVARAAVQAITIDEADTFVTFAGQSWPSQWYSAANNQVLNSLLMRLFTSVFGIHNLSVRSPALIGAAIYIGSAYFLCRVLYEGRRLQWILFVCLVYNPFVFDYLVAARGYSLALGFLLCGAGIAIRAFLCDEREPSKVAWTCGVCSGLLGLSFAANFSFAFVLAAAMLAILAWAWTTQTPKRRIIMACVLPGLAVTVFLCSSVLARWPRHGQLIFGAKSMGEALWSVIDASFFKLNAFLVNPDLYRVLKYLRYSLFFLVVLLALWRIFTMWRGRREPSDRGTRRLYLLGVGLVAILVVALGVHWLCFTAFHLLLPKGRTAAYLAPLGVLIAGAIAAVPGRSRWERAAHKSLAVALAVTAGYFILCLRLTYFQEWWWDAEVDKVYWVLCYYNHNYGVEDVPMDWMYSSALNYYRVASGHESFHEFTGYTVPGSYPADRPLYVLHAIIDRDFIASQNLNVVYHGTTDVVVAVRPAALARLQTSGCGGIAPQ